MRILFVLVAVLLLGVGFSGPPPNATLGARAEVTATPIVLGARRTGRLTFLGGVRLMSGDPAFGGFSSLSVAGSRFTLLSDAGDIVSFSMGADWVPRAARFAMLPAGPGTGWEKRDRDSESMARDPASGRIWVGFEGANAIWRYAPGFAQAERVARPPAMRDWEANGGAESLALLPRGGFVTISEVPPGESRRRVGVRFFGDPTLAPRRGFRFSYVPSGGFDVSDAAALPNGDLLVLERRFTLPFTFAARLALVPRGTIRPGAVVRGQTVARLAKPLLVENFEGLAVAREGAATILWLATDNDQSRWRPSLLLKFRLD